MNQRVAFPFSRLDDKSVGFKGWLIGDPDQPLIPATDILEGWDYERDLEVCAQFEFDLDRAAHLLDIPEPELDIAIVLKAGTGAGKMPRRTDRICVERVATGEMSLRSAVPLSAQLSGRLFLEAEVLLTRNVTRTSPLSPALCGSRLWSHRRDILLEDGGSARFPLEVLSFSSAFARSGQERAPWYIHWRTGSLDADFGGAVRVYVNSDFPDICDRFVAGDLPTIQVILGDVMSQMIEHVIRLPDCEEHLEEYVEGSIGEQISNWLNMTFPGQSVSKVKAEMEDAPGRFRATILAAARLGGGVE